MGGVDRMDQNVVKYRTAIRSKNGGGLSLRTAWICVSSKHGIYTGKRVHRTIPKQRICWAFDVPLQEPSWLVVHSEKSQARKRQKLRVAYCPKFGLIDWTIFLSPMQRNWDALNVVWRPSIGAASAKSESTTDAMLHFTLSECFWLLLMPTNQVLFITIVIILLHCNFSTKKRILILYSF